MTASIDRLDNHDLGHIPYLVLLLHYLGEWKKTSPSNGPPITYAEKKQFITFLAAGARKGQDAENFEEGTAAVLKLLQMPTLEDSVTEVFEFENPLMVRVVLSWIEHQLIFR